MQSDYDVSCVQEFRRTHPSWGRWVVPYIVSIFFEKLVYVLLMKVVQASVAPVPNTLTLPIVDLVLKMQDERYLLCLSSLFYVWLLRKSSQ